MSLSVAQWIKTVTIIACKNETTGPTVAQTMCKEKWQTCTDLTMLNKAPTYMDPVKFYIA